MRFQLVPKSLTLDDLERPKCTLLQKRCVFWSPLHKFGCNISKRETSNRVAGDYTGLVHGPLDLEGHDWCRAYMYVHDINMQVQNRSDWQQMVRRRTCDINRR